MIGLPSLKEVVTRENFSFFADIFSLVSFIISILVFWNVRNLRNAFSFSGASTVADQRAFPSWLEPK